MHDACADLADNKEDWMKTRVLHIRAQSKPIMLCCNPPCHSCLSWEVLMRTTGCYPATCLTITNSCAMSTSRWWTEKSTVTGVPSHTTVKDVCPCFAPSKSVLSCLTAPSASDSSPASCAMVACISWQPYIQQAQPPVDCYSWEDGH